MIGWNSMTDVLDEYATDHRTWKVSGEMYQQASSLLFTQPDTLMWLPAATLAHHAIERYLKAALIVAGVTICTKETAKKAEIHDHIWGHDLVELGKRLGKLRREFKLNALLPISAYILQTSPCSVEMGLSHFDPFFTELRYPQRLERMDPVSPQDPILLDHIMDVV